MSLSKIRDLMDEHKDVLNPALEVDDTNPAPRVPISRMLREYGVQTVDVPKEPTTTVCCSYGCSHLVEATSPQDAHRMMEEHYALRH